MRPSATMETLSRLFRPATWLHPAMQIVQTLSFSFVAQPAGLLPGQTLSFKGQILAIRPAASVIRYSRTRRCQPTARWWHFCLGRIWPRNNDDLSPEVYAADFTGSGLTNIRQITKTKAEAPGTANAGSTLTLLSPGRRLSRDGKFVAYESRAEDPTANSATNTAFLASFVSDVPINTSTSSTAKAVGPRAATTSQVGDVIHFPTFTNYNGSLSPSTVVFASALNFKTRRNVSRSGPGQHRLESSAIRIGSSKPDICDAGSRNFCQHIYEIDEESRNWVCYRHPPIDE